MLTMKQKQRPEYPAPLKDGSAKMSSMVRILLYSSPLLISAAALATTLAPGRNATLSTPQAQPSAQPQQGASAPAAAPLQRSSPAAVASAVAQWNSLRQTDSLGFDSYANFLLAHPGWPDEARMRRLAESKADPMRSPPSTIVAFFTRFPPRTAAGYARFAEALTMTGREADAFNASRQAWVTGPLTDVQEAQLFARFGGRLTPADHETRMDTLLWQGATGAAGRQIAFIPAARRSYYDTRLALRTKRYDADALYQALGPSATADAGLVYDRAHWLRENSRSLEARALLAQPLRLTAPPKDPQAWLALLLQNARGARNDSQYQFAYAIASNAEVALPAGTEVSDQSLGVRDDYTSLVWLGGQVALFDLRRPADAVVMFERYARAARSPQTQTKGLYWAGRAALAAGDKARADILFAAAAQHGDQFYGQLSAERLNRRPAPLQQAATTMPTAAERAAFESNELVQAARLLGSRGVWRDQSLFLRTIANNVETEADHVLIGELARQLSRPDLGVMAARQWRNSGRGAPIRIGYPEIPNVSAYGQQWTLIHAITRQESQFDREAVSSAGARGLMQLMPGTARETASKIGLEYEANRLTSDPRYNIMLGANYFSRVLDSFGGNYVLAVAAYNAGPGNVRKWLNSNGDPRSPSVDVVEWIEQIPFAETRGYVQRVLENAVVYDQLNPSGPRMSAERLLSAYLGKNLPG